MYISDAQTTALKDRLPEYLLLTNRSTIEPFCCANPNHADRHPSMRYYRARNKVHCFSCGCTYDLFDLVGADYNIQNFNDAKTKANEILGRGIAKAAYAPIQDKTNVSTYTIQYDFTEEIDYAHTALLSNSAAIKHFTDRGLSLDIIHKYKLGYSDKGYNSMLAKYPELRTRAHKQFSYKYVLPYFEENGDCHYFLTEISDRSLIDEFNGKYRKISGLSATIFNERYLKGSSPDIIFVTEGLYDALSIEDIGYHAIALSGSSCNHVLHTIEKYKPKTSFVLMCDNDNAGNKANITLNNILRALEYKCTIENPGYGNDVNEAFCTNKAVFKFYIDDIVRKFNVS